jgi:general secretion pathway protein C
MTTIVPGTIGRVLFAACVATAAIAVAVCFYAGPGYYGAAENSATGTVVQKPSGRAAIKSRAITPFVAISSDAPEAPLLALKGTSEPDYAVFVDKETRAERLFKTGAEVFGKGILRNVLRDKAYVESEGAVYAYRMGGESFRGENKAASGRVAASRPAARADAYAPEPFGRRVGKDAWEMDRGAVEAALGRFDSVLRDAKFTRASFPAGDGFVVSELRPAGVFARAGIRESDVIVSVNGFDASRTENWPRLLDLLAYETEFSVEIMRNNKPRVLTYAVR